MLRRTMIALFAVIGWILAGFVGFLLYAALQRPVDDPISLAGRQTAELLALHEKHDQTNKIIAWLEMYHGEAPGHQVMMSFIDWATNNRTAAESLLARIPAEPLLMERLAFAVADSAQTEEFCGVYAASHSQGVKEFLARIQRYQPACE